MLLFLMKTRILMKQNSIYDVDVLNFKYYGKLILEVYYSIFTNALLMTDPTPHPPTNIATEKDAAMSWYSAATTFGANMKPMFPMYPFDIENIAMKTIYHHSDEKTTCNLKLNRLEYVLAYYYSVKWYYSLL